MESECECCGESSTYYYLGMCGKCIKSLPKLRAALEEAAELFECADDGHGVNFNLCASDIRSLLEGVE